jgi:hypothetical protein
MIFNCVIFLIWCGFFKVRTLEHDGIEPLATHVFVVNIRDALGPEPCARRIV